MVSPRCKMILREELKKASLSYSISPYGAIEFLEETSQDQLEALNNNLLRSGLELLDENDSILIDRIINMVIEVIHYSDELPMMSFEEIMNKSLGSEGESILKIFSDVKGISIIQFIVLQKVERVKELLLYEDLSLAEIAEKLRYQSVPHLTAQFKKFTGLSPGYYKKLKNEREKILS